MLFFVTKVLGQGNFTLHNMKYDKVSFELINNLIIIPVEVNGVELSFLLDTGVSKPIIFNVLNLTEDLKINETERIFLRGLGEGESVEALKSSNNIFSIGNAINFNQDLYVIFDQDMNFAPRLGVPIHGIIGYDLMKDFIVEVNYARRFIKMYNRDKYRSKSCKKCKTLNLEFYNKKPYVVGEVILNAQKIPVKLLIDSGGSDGLWLFENSDLGLDLPQKFFDDYLGRGLSGSVYGKRAKIPEFILGEFEMEQVNVAFPDSISIAYARKFKSRNGTVSGEVLKRFNLLFDYQKKKLRLKRNRYFFEPFYYNKSGIVLAHDGIRIVKTVQKNVPAGIAPNPGQNTTPKLVFSGSYKYDMVPSFKIVELRVDSPAYKVGLELGDIILSVNNKNAHEYSMQDITQMFCDKEGKRIKLLVDREGKQMSFSFRLENLL
jgi:hypothetical protein